MPTLLRVSAPEEFPDPADTQAAAIGLERWHERAQEDEAEMPGSAAWAEALIGQPNGRRMLEAIFGNSPFLTECLLAEPGFLKRLIDDGAAETLERLLGEIGEGAATLDTPALMARLP